MRNKKKPVKHFKRLLHMSDGSVWSWRLKRRADRESGGFEQGIQVRSPKGLDTFIHESAFVGPERLVGVDGHTLCNPYGCDICAAYKHSGPGYQPSVIKNYINTVIINKKSWESP